MFYKKVEKINDTASLGFQETRTSASNTLDTEILFTYASLQEEQTPYGNLFKSFRLPITNEERDSFFGLYSNTAISFLQTDSIIVAEIPKGEYGELIDGKTFRLTFPVVLSGVPSSTTVYGSYFGFVGKSGLTFDTKLNEKLFEKQTYLNNLSSSLLYSNITFLYSNDIKKPIGDITSTQIYNSAITITSSNFQLNVSASTNDIIFLSITNSNIGTAVGTLGFNGRIDNQELKVNTFVTIGEVITNRPIFITTTASKPSATLTIKISKITINNLNWNQWTTANRFPTNVNNIDSNNKSYALYDGKFITIDGERKFLNVFDQPVGILFNDKGIAVITDPTLVSGFRYSAGTSTGYNGIASGSPYNGDENFAKIYFTGTNCETNYNSITTEFVQNVLCIASPNVFFNTTNSTYLNSYDESVTNKPVFITSVGLYNKYGELIGVGKMSEPIKKEKSSIVPFNVKLKL
jgi:hypothetical protein